jgi:glycosyltransferase involved in cell wall biosynthesis
LRIAVYAIAKNEAQHVERFLESCRDADHVLVCDTGSTDGTWSALCRKKPPNLRVWQIAICPWRFDDARNAALALLPESIDVCVPLDLDEVLVPGWRGILERAWRPGTTRLRYGFVWSWRAPGEPGVTFFQDKVHARRGYRWRLPVHEVLAADPRVPERISSTSDRLVEHHPDPAKSRGGYLELLRLAAGECPTDDRVAHYYGRELMFRGEHEPAVSELVRHLTLPSAAWKPERAASMRFIARCKRALGFPSEARYWLDSACAEDPLSREPWVENAQLAHDQRRWSDCLAAAERALAIDRRAEHYISEPYAWGSAPHDLASIACWNLGRGADARDHARRALRLAIGADRDRIEANVELMEEPGGEPPEHREAADRLDASAGA